MDIMEAMARAAADAEPSMPQPDAAADTLRERFAALQVQHAFAAGDLVIPKRGLDCRVDRVRNIPMVFIGFRGPMDPPEKDMRGHAAWRQDCFVLALMPDGDAVPQSFDSRTLEPWPPALAEAA